MATRIERLEESNRKHELAIVENNKKIEEERQKLIANREKEEKKLREAQEKFEKLYGKIDAEQDSNEESSVFDENN